MTATVTTSGLQNLVNPAAAQFQGQWAAATGTADAIVAAYATPNTALTDGLLLAFRALSTNLTTTPTFNPDGLGAVLLTGFRVGNGMLASWIVAGGEYLVRYNLANTVWVLLNPST